LPVAQPKPAPADIDYEMWLGPAPWRPYNDQLCSFNWYFIYDFCIGWIGSWGVHHIDIAIWGAPVLAEKTIEIEGTGVFPKEGQADTSMTWDVNVLASNGRLHDALASRTALVPSAAMVVNSLHCTRPSLMSVCRSTMARS